MVFLLANLYTADLTYKDNSPTGQPFQLSTDISEAPLRFVVCRHGLHVPDWS